MPPIGRADVSSRGEDRAGTAAPESLRSRGRGRDAHACGPGAWPFAIDGVGDAGGPGARRRRRAVSQRSERGLDPHAIGRRPARVCAPHVRVEQRACRGARDCINRGQGHAGRLRGRVDRRLRAPLTTGGAWCALACGAGGGAHRPLRRNPRARGRG